MEREVRYCTAADGVRIAYCVEGEGPPLLVCPEFAESFSLLHLFPEYERFVAELGRGRSLVRYDPRGCGLSQRDVDDLTFNAFLRDAEAVVGGARLKRFALWGATDGGILAASYAAKHPSKVSRLVLYGTFARSEAIFAREVAKGFAAMCRASWDSVAPMMATNTLRQGFPDAAVGLGQVVLRATNGETFARYIEANYEVDIMSLLPQIKAPTLVLHRMNDASFPLAVAQEVAAQIPNAQLVVLAGEVHHQAAGDSLAIIDASNTFLNVGKGTTQRTRAQAPAAASQRSLRTVLFTDLAGSTEMMSRLGDERGREVLREHERITREVLAANGGTEVKTMGDGFMASFGSVTKAVECAIALQRRFAEWNTGVGAHRDAPLQVRVGLNAGEPIEEDGDLFGATVILASRIAAKAEGGEILGSDVVRGLCSGKGFAFADRGEFIAKGFEEPVRLFEVSWREQAPTTAD